jgi:predicted metal-dependent hydrolase
LSQKRETVAAMVESFLGGELDAHYLAFFECFNHQLYFEAHEVLEVLWLPERRGPEGAFYKGLIQLAGGFVHVQKGRPGPAAALFRLARTNLERYPATHQRLSVTAVLKLLDEWLGRLEPGGGTASPFSPANAPQLELAAV